MNRHLLEYRRAESAAGGRRDCPNVSHGRGSPVHRIAGCRVAGDRYPYLHRADDFDRLLSRTLPYTDGLVGDDHVLLRLHGDLETDPLHPLAAAGMDAYVSGPQNRRRLIEQVADGPTEAQDKQPYS
ncbi:hypothetical protein [Streptomyces sp. BV129]|uniref:hypothetical protein n=1 Tax=Streptomyces sp. BV129 TaxID=2849671 RepID=UPI001C2E6A49|nr:hypothetical protein [Streptomyces sp. BV129]MBV1948759.1 hypothetical protein [Streptomyces sp. BV129]